MATKASGFRCCPSSAPPDVVYGRGAALAKKIDSPPLIDVPAPFCSSVATVCPMEPKTLMVGRNAYDAPPDISLRSRSDSSTSGVSVLRHARLTPTLAFVLSLTANPF